MLFSAKSTLLVLAKMCYLTGLLFKKATKKNLNMNSLPVMEAPSPLGKPSGGGDLAIREQRAKE